MKKIISFLLCNRFTFVAICWVVGFIFINYFTNPYLNGFVLLFLIFFTLFYLSYMIEETELNDNEKKVLHFLNKIL